MATEAIVRQGLEVLLKKVNREIARVEARLQKLARDLGLSSWGELENFFSMRGLDNPDIDMLWSEYVYLRDRLEALRRYRLQILKELGRVKG